MAERQKIALVTGATSGIGNAVATGLAKAGFHVTLLARNKERGEAAAKGIEAAVSNASLDVLVGDLASQKSVRQAAATFVKDYDRLDVLINCAGVFLPDRKVTEDGVEETFAINYLGPFLLTNLLLPLMKKSAPARIVSVASPWGGAKLDFDDLNFERNKFSYLKAVPRTKLAQVLFTQELAERTAGSGVVVNAIHPGLVAHTKLLDQTGGFFQWMTNRMGGTPEKGADTAVWLATAPEAEAETGGFWHKRKRTKTPGQASDPAARKRLWQESERLTAPAKVPAEAKSAKPKKK